MTWQFTPYIIPSFIAAIISITLIIYAVRHRATPSATTFIALMVAVTIWSLGNVMELGATALTAKIFWAKIEYLGIVSVPVIWLIFSLQFSRLDKWVTRRHVVLLTVIPVITLLMVWTNEMHALHWAAVTLENVGQTTSLDITYGPWFWIQSIYAYILLLFGTIRIIYTLTRTSHIYRSQAIVILVGVLAPWLANIIYLTTPIKIDPTPFAFALTGAALGWGLFRFQLLQITPIIRRIIIDSMNDSIIVLDMQNRIADLNPAAQLFIDQTLDEAIGTPCPAMLAELVAAHPRYGHTELVTEINDTQQYFDVTISTLYSGQRQPIGRLIVLRNITQRKQTEEQLRKLSRAVEQSPSITVITNTDGNIEYVNPKFTEITGYTADEAIGQNPRILKYGDKTSDDYQNLWQTIAAGKSWHGELRNKRKNGEAYWAAVSISPVKNDHGDITHYVAVQEDITKRKEYEVALALARDEALEASRLKSQLLANVSHDLRTPLNAILGYTEMLQAGVYGSLEDRQQEATSEIIDSTGQLLNFVNNLLNQAQIEAGKIKVKLSPFDPRKLIDDMKAMLDVVARSNNLELTSDIAPEVPATLPGDLYWLRQILANLISNAIKFTEQGSVHVYIFLPDENHWAMQVTDTGQGIATEAQQYIFDPFRQIDGSLTRGHMGSGLGLSIVKELTELMDGDLTLSSTVGQGSTFTVSLPLIPLQELPE